MFADEVERQLVRLEEDQMYDREEHQQEYE